MLALVAALARHAVLVRGNWVASSRLLYAASGAAVGATGVATAGDFVSAGDRSKGKEENKIQLQPQKQRS